MRRVGFHPSFVPPYFILQALTRDSLPPDLQYRTFFSKKTSTIDPLLPRQRSHKRAPASAIASIPLILLLFGVCYTGIPPTYSIGEYLWADSAAGLLRNLTNSVNERCH